MSSYVLKAQTTRWNLKQHKPLYFFYIILKRRNVILKASCFIAGDHVGGANFRCCLCCWQRVRSGPGKSISCMCTYWECPNVLTNLIVMQPYLMYNNLMPVMNCPWTRIPGYSCWDHLNFETLGQVIPATYVFRDTSLRQQYDHTIQDKRRLKFSYTKFEHHFAGLYFLPEKLLANYSR
jgi:hypothetical protein